MAVAVVTDQCRYLDGEQADVSITADQFNFLSNAFNVRLVKENA